jgi:hypothetical protein
MIYLALSSIHQYNGSYTTAELLFYLTDSTNQSLWISIPINSNSSSSSPLLTNILTDIVDYQLNESGESKTVNINNYTLNDIIPYKPYYYYQNNNVNVIAYGIENALYIQDSILTSLSSYITVISDSEKAQIFPYTTTLLQNTKGPITGQSGEIYIDCQPVNSSNETSIYAFNKPSSAITIDGVKSNINFMQLLSMLGLNQTTLIIVIAMSIILILYMYPLLSGGAIKGFQTLRKSINTNTNSNVPNVINGIPVFQMKV